MISKAERRGARGGDKGGGKNTCRPPPVVAPMITVNGYIEQTWIDVRQEDLADISVLSVGQVNKRRML